MCLVKETEVSKIRCISLICGLMSLVAVGCGQSGPKLYPVSGTVTYDGQPLEGASVLFIPQGGRPSMGMTDGSGKFTIATNGKPGAPQGTYNVTVSKQAGATAAAAAEMPADSEEVGEEEMKKMQDQMRKMTEGGMMNRSSPKSAIPEKYALPEGSGLNATVTDDASKNVFEFPLTP